MKWYDIQLNQTQTKMRCRKRKYGRWAMREDVETLIKENDKMKRIIEQVWGGSWTIKAIYKMLSNRELPKY